MEYEGLNLRLLDQITHPPRRVLDLGCGVGNLGRVFKERWNCDVTGVTYSAQEAERASQYLDRVFVSDLNEWTPDSLEKFDLIVCSHVLEHLYRPEQLLQRLTPCPRRRRDAGGGAAQPAVLEGAPSTAARPLPLHGRRHHGLDALSLLRLRHGPGTDPFGRLPGHPGAGRWRGAAGAASPSSFPPHGRRGSTNGACAPFPAFSAGSS